MQDVRSFLTASFTGYALEDPVVMASFSGYSLEDPVIVASPPVYGVEDGVMNETITGDVVMVSRAIVMLSNVKLSFSFSENDFTPVYYIIIY